MHGPHIKCYASTQSRRVSESKPHLKRQLRQDTDTASHRLICTVKLEKYNMALLVDRLRPRSLDSLTYHPELSARLKSLVPSSPPLVYLKRTKLLIDDWDTGTKWRLSPSPRLRPLRRRQKNPHNRNPQRTVRPRSRKNQNRRSRLPDNQ
jgi:hypothetical protein